MRMSTRLWRGASLVFALAAGCASQRTGSAGPDVQAFLERALAEARTAHGFPAAAAAVVTSREIHVAAVGRRRIDGDEAVTLDDRFGLGSNTKAFTAAMLGALVERGALRWDLTFAEAFPDLELHPEYRDVTLRQMLSHRAGLQPWTSDEAFARARRLYTGDLTTTRLAFARTVLAEPPAYPPGTQTRYSNADYVLAALIGERVAHRSWEELVDGLVCKPLRITCSFAGSRAPDPHQPWAHSRATGGLVPIEPKAAGPVVMEGAGGLALSIRDYAVFVQANLRGLRGEDTVLLRAGTIQELHRPVDGPYALGWHQQQYAGALSTMHAGGNGDFYAIVAIQPTRDLAVAFLTNDGGDEVETQASTLLKRLLAGPATRSGRATPGWRGRGGGRRRGPDGLRGASRSRARGASRGRRRRAAGRRRG